MKTKAKKQAEQRNEAMRQDALRLERQKARAAHKIEAEPCLYCGQPTLCRDYIINPGAIHELPCCRRECFSKAKEFVDYDSHKRNIFYLLMSVFVVANLFVFGLSVTAWWRYLPMLGLGLSAVFYPLIFTRYERYQIFGIRRTQSIIRFVAGAIAAFAFVLTVAGRLG